MKNPCIKGNPGAGRLVMIRDEPPHPETNVRSIRVGEGSADGVAGELDRFVVTTMPVPWEHARERIGGSPLEIVHVESMEQAVVDRQLAGLPEFECVVAIGGGQAVDLGKYFAWKRGCRLVTIPTVLSVDAFVTPGAGIRVNGKVEYLGNCTPDPLVIDHDLIRTAPPELNIAGVGDLFSIHTATRDWELAEQAGRSEYPFSVEAVQKARVVLERIISKVDSIREQENAGLEAIVEGYMAFNRICLPAGHYRVEEGSEHYLFYELEERLCRAFIHGPIIGLGIHLMSRLQNNRHSWIREAMDAVGLRYQPADMCIGREELHCSLENLSRYVKRREDLWYTVIDEEHITPEWIEEVLEPLSFA